MTSKTSCVELLAGPATTIGWSQDSVRPSKRELVCLVRAADLSALEAKSERLEGELERLEGELKNALTKIARAKAAFA